MTDFHLQHHLDTLYQETDHEFEFWAREPQEARLWQEEFRLALRDVLKITGRLLPDSLKTQLLSSTDKGTYIEEKHNLLIDEVATPLYLLIPKSEPPYHPVIAFHGHGMGVNVILGKHDDPTIVKQLRASDDNFAQQLAEDGYLVCAIEQQGFGERITNLTNLPQFGNSCRHLAFTYLLHNQTLLGERVWDGMNAISYLLGRDDVITEKLTCVGFSGGGTTALFLSALDERIQQAIIAGYLCTLQQSILGVEHCECNYVPDLLTLGETGDIAGLIAPRPLLAISGELDPIFPVAGVREQYAQVEKIYRVFGTVENCSLAIHPHGHRFHYASMAEWLQH